MTTADRTTRYAPALEAVRMAKLELDYMEDHLGDTWPMDLPYPRELEAKTRVARRALDDLAATLKEMTS